VTRKYLLVVRAGDHSLHPGWLNGDRNWDLHISYFGSQEQPFGALPTDVTLSHEKGPKYLGLSECLATHPDFLERYALIGFPDDDLACRARDWNAAFSVLDEIGADLGQPALDPRSFFSYDIFLRRKQFRYREVDFVELMCPVFSTPFLREILPTWTLNASSWGLDYLWRERARRDGRRLAIVDEVGILHTRAIGKGAQYSAANMKGGSRYDDYETILKMHGIKDLSRRALSGVRKDGRSSTKAFMLNRTLVLAGLRRKLRNVLNVESIT
jgi:hypothetical protein